MILDSESLHLEPPTLQPDDQLIARLSQAARAGSPVRSAPTRLLVLVAAVASAAMIAVSGTLALAPASKHTPETPDGPVPAPTSRSTPRPPRATAPSVSTPTSRRPLGPARPADRRPAPSTVTSASSRPPAERRTRALQPQHHRDPQAEPRHDGTDHADDTGGEGHSSGGGSPSPSVGTGDSADPSEGGRIAPAPEGASTGSEDSSHRPVATDSTDTDRSGDSGQAMGES